MGFCLFRGVSWATIVKPDFGELALTNRGGLINPVLTLHYFRIHALYALSHVCFSLYTYMYMCVYLWEYSCNVCTVHVVCHLLYVCMEVFM